VGMEEVVRFHLWQCPGPSQGIVDIFEWTGIGNTWFLRFFPVLWF
jgi:hypothetical protein